MNIVTASLELRLRAVPPLRVDLTGLTPATLTGLGEAEAARLPVRHGNEMLALGELFDVVRRPQYGGRLSIEGDLSRFDHLGRDMEAGEIHVDGTVGDYAGAHMRGGVLAINGDAGDFTACEMAGGEVVVSGNVGDFAAGALPGSMDGMRGGALIVRGNAAARFADRMRRGTAIVFGDVGDFLAARMVAGTVALGGGCGAHPGYGMRRGSLVFAGTRPPIPPTFVETGHDIRVIWTLLARDLARVGGPFADLPRSVVRRWVGDLAADGKGEWFLR